jgi:DNA (cytosine-5)-methyltransferase 1
LSINSSYNYIFSERLDELKYTAVSLFSGGGISDIGYESAGFKFIVQSEKNNNRAKLLENNFARSKCINGEVRNKTNEIVDCYKSETESRLDLLSITPPCQGMSSSNPGRGKITIGKTSDERNLLLLDALPIIFELNPKIIVIENVPQLLNRVVCYGGGESKIIDIFNDKIREKYKLFLKIIQMADYGIPQIRRRAVLVALNLKDFSILEIEKLNLVPIPRKTHSCNPSENEIPWVSLQQWLNYVKYPKLDSSRFEIAHCDDDTLHFVPNYDKNRYLLISDIPTGSGKSAYQNTLCHFCGNQNVPDGLAYCPICNNPMINRPYVIEKDGTYRLIKGFKSSYRRMYPNRPAATITTANGHIGSDYKIHPFENRLLSIRECADLQSIPRFYNWDWAIKEKRFNLIREVVGEALPPWFTYQHGLLLRSLLENRFDYSDFSES